MLDAERRPDLQHEGREVDVLDGGARPLDVRDGGHHGAVGARVRPDDAVPHLSGRRRCGHGLGVGPGPRDEAGQGERAREDGAGTHGTDRRDAHGPAPPAQRPGALARGAGVDGGEDGVERYVRVGARALGTQSVDRVVHGVVPSRGESAAVAVVPAVAAVAAAYDGAAGDGRGTDRLGVRLGDGLGDRLGVAADRSSSA